jgi:hypothetical protein
MGDETWTAWRQDIATPLEAHCRTRAPRLGSARLPTNKAVFVYKSQEFEMFKQTSLVRVQLSEGASCKVSLGAMKSPFITRQQQPQVQLRAAAPVSKVSLGAMKSPFLTRQQRG